MDNLQYYPTPDTLIQKMWFTFKDRDFARILEPSAGDGRLLKFHGKFHDTDACEINMDLHPTLKDKGIQVVSLDFMDLQEGSMYSHIIMNPPFKDGAEHLLHAWDILYSGEIVCLLNAETLKNPFSQKRSLLNSLIEKHGSVEFLTDAFMTEDTERKTEVEVALVHLTKVPEQRHDFLDTIIDGLDRNEREDVDYDPLQELSIPTNVIQNAVKAFDCAWAAQKEAIIMEARVSHYRRMLGKSLREMQRETSHPDDINPAPKSKRGIHGALNTAYEDLKDRGWSYVIRSTEVNKMTSTKVQQDLESRFESVKKMDFTVGNIYGFLQGLAMSKGDIQLDMACEIFDQITKYHSDNTVYYMGWKSNDKHRMAGMRIRANRFILPGFSMDSWQRSLGYYARKILEDIDKVFAMLDGKDCPRYGLIDAFEGQLSDLRGGQRVKTDYFDIRFYPGIGTIHFFPNNEKIMDRLNVMVGLRRQWIPENATPEQENPFWKQYREAEKFNKGLRLTRQESWALSNRETAYRDDSYEETMASFHNNLVSSMEKLGYQSNFALVDCSSGSACHTATMSLPKPVDLAS
ncbi:hypothetical protein B1757_02865 [Acidithiobacillus marinus]|uniref:DUF4942 domain-containing protein n=1 Tax=Acidithiobacillus marinus TaxID=187490 RepID=A0A2I1DPI3_9PROT|nr:DUF4942 domain-containing protein [Acidithiobacillus marinus]PKY11749.1 hypothetical protein B1757_02865 [Acidithiobacillus marinus]